MNSLIEIDGSYLEGGGQILRTALGLSAVTKRPVRIFNIRKGRPNPGLQAQHLEAINAMEQMCDADVHGAYIHSCEVMFRPNKINGGTIKIDIPTAGSAGLVLQPLMIAALDCETAVTINIIGGATSAKWAMPMNYAKYVLLPLLEKMGYMGHIEIKRHGYYPKGGAHVVVKLAPGKLTTIDLIKKGNLVSIEGISHASSRIKNKLVAERQAKSAEKLLENEFNTNVKISVVYDNTANAGSAIELFAYFENTVMGAGSIGEINMHAEDVGRSAAVKLIEEIKSDACVDEYAQDQLLPFMAISGTSSIKVGQVTRHAMTNMWVIEKFIPVKFHVNEKKKAISCSPI